MLIFHFFCPFTVSHSSQLILCFNQVSLSLPGAASVKEMGLRHFSVVEESSHHDGLQGAIWGSLGDSTGKIKNQNKWKTTTNNKTKQNKQPNQTQLDAEENISKLHIIPTTMWSGIQILSKIVGWPFAPLCSKKTNPCPCDWVIRGYSLFSNRFPSR